MESQPRRADVMSKAPNFSCLGLYRQEDKFRFINDYAGKWLVIFFLPQEGLDFGYMPPSKLLELEVHRPEMESLNCKYSIDLISIRPWSSSPPASSPSTVRGSTTSHISWLATSQGCMMLTTSRQPTSSSTLLRL